MKKYNIRIYGISGQDGISIKSNAENEFDKKLIMILAELGNSIDCQGSSDGDYDRAIYEIKELCGK